MTIIILLIAISLSIAVLFLAIFYWNMKSGQYDDTYTPSVRMLFDHKFVKNPKEKADGASPPINESPESKPNRHCPENTEHKGGQTFPGMKGVQYPDRHIL
jgi:cbb3-type cytochrome oxidase maturation protein